MNQQSHTDKNGTSKDVGAGVTAVLDSMIRTTDNRERTTEQPLRAKAPATPKMAVDVRDTPAAPARSTTQTPTTADSSSTVSTSTTSKAPSATGAPALPAPAVRIRFSEGSP